MEKNLFTPRLGWAYRPTDSTVIRVGYSRNPQNDTSGREQMPPFNAYPATIIYTETAANTYTAIGTLAEGFPMVPVLDLTVGRLNPVNAGLTTYPLNDEFERGKISSWNVSMQQLLPYGHSLTLGYVANRQNGHDPQREPELRTAGRRNGEPAVLLDNDQLDQHPGP